MQCWTTDLFGQSLASDHRHHRLRLNIDCGSSPEDISVVVVGNVIVPNEPYLTKVVIKCREGVKLFTKDYSNHHNNIQYVFYATIHTTGIAHPCTFEAPNVVPGTNIQRYTATLSLHWSDYRQSHYQVKCDSNPFTTPSAPGSGISPRQSESRTDSKQFHRQTPQNTNVSPKYGSPSISTTATSPKTNGPTTSTTTSTTRLSTETSSVSGSTELGRQRKEDYVLLIEPYCGSSDRNDAWIEIVTDLNLDVVGICKDNVTVPFTSKDRIHFSLRVLYDGSKSAADQCVFQKRKNSKVYNLRVEISRGNVNKYIHTRKRDYQVTCTFEDFANKTSLASRSLWRLIAPKELQSHQGAKASSVITMDVVDILSRRIHRIPLGKKIRLRLISDGAAGELGIRPSSCDIVGSATAHRYALLRAGCGDGIIFPRGSGFTSNGLKAVSPYFESVGLSEASHLMFECNYTLCTSVCNGSSCENERRRRDDVEYRLVNVHRSTEKSSSIHKVVTTISYVKPPSSSLVSPLHSPGITSQMSTTRKLGNTAACTTVTSPGGGNRHHAKISPLVALASLGFVVVISLVVAVYLFRQRSLRYIEIHSKV
ncbi:vitelline envelope sperm lysin receptor-like isoform X2 [Haliotis asinina]|uniref:vitelline envelope sperm lysin receptor-like isoform X2 n=1 Tax=Haliotis asinina TaxID=109174 RepID=UPI00353261E4